MLLKLIKHELKASYKLIWPIYIGMICLALLCKLVIFPFFTSNRGFILNFICILFLLAFVIGMFALTIMPIVVSGYRFKKSILSNEGYLTMTLPVSSHQLLISKLIVNAIWYSLTGILILTISSLMATDINDLSFLNIDLTGFKFHVPVIHVVVCFLELLLNYVALISLITLIVYASYAIGYCFNKHKSLITVILIYVFFHICFWLMIGSTFLMSIPSFDIANYSGPYVTYVRLLEMILLISLLFLVIISLLFYFITNHFITKKLNLE